MLRNKILEDIWDARGKIAWKKSSSYHRRSLVDTHISRLNTMISGTLRSRTMPNQKVEALIMAKILNKMTSLGMPKSVKISFEK